MEFTVVQGDIAAREADALVNAAGTSLQMGSGIAGALRRAGGDRLNEAAVEQGPIDLEEGARIICEVVDGYDPGSLSDVRLIAYDEGEYETIQRVADEIRHISQ